MLASLHLTGNRFDAANPSVCFVFLFLISFSVVQDTFVAYGVSRAAIANGSILLVFDNFVMASVSV